MPLAQSVVAVLPFSAAVFSNLEMRCLCANPVYTRRRAKSGSRHGGCRRANAARSPAMTLIGALRLCAPVGVTPGERDHGLSTMC